MTAYLELAKSQSNSSGCSLIGTLQSGQGRGFRCFHVATGVQDLGLSVYGSMAWGFGAKGFGGFRVLFWFMGSRVQALRFRVLRWQEAGRGSENDSNTVLW